MNKHTNAFARTQGHVNKHTHQMHQNPSITQEGKGEETGRGTETTRMRRTDKKRYLFVHFDVEAVRHLIVLRKTESGG